MRDRTVNYRKIWEDANGPIPYAHHIHHIDGDHTNNDLSNLICVSPYEHYLIHKNQGDIKEAAMLFARFVKGTTEFPCYPYALEGKDSVWLYRNQPGLIKIPRSAKEKGVKEPKVLLFGSMDWVEIIDEPYSEPDVELAQEILNKLNAEDAYILKAFYGIDVKRNTWEELAKELGVTVGALRKKKSRIIKKIQNEMV